MAFSLASILLDTLLLDLFSQEVLFILKLAVQVFNFLLLLGDLCTPLFRDLIHLFLGFFKSRNVTRI